LVPILYIQQVTGCYRVGARAAADWGGKDKAQ
jgi:hypothetical protein